MKTIKELEKEIVALKEKGFSSSYGIMISSTAELRQTNEIIKLIGDFKLFDEDRHYMFQDMGDLEYYIDLNKIKEELIAKLKGEK